jgi:hypothetical protein
VIFDDYAKEPYSDACPSLRWNLFNQYYQRRTCCIVLFFEFRSFCIAKLQFLQ